MWEWSRTVAERAAAAAISNWWPRESEPTVVDPELAMVAGMRALSLVR
ncbi:hypothetical protein NDR86_30360 [Nocardia sp. CDC141]|uniref:Uncharacterized protein n=1 Tax=Nocardia pulmonis TaxID=2951408 RepID=A0A9X2EBR1_9NOCA|nr:hypothetical protein [Nocardia pulmonis]